MTKKYWIATHYPHPVPDTAPWHIFFRKKPGTVPDVGDEVLFYETHVPQADRDRIGRKGIICAAMVSGALSPMTGIGAWVFQVPCTEHRSGRLVPLEKIRSVIRGPFYRQTLWRLSEDEYQKLVKEMEM